MFRTTVVAALGIALAGLPVLTGCDDKTVKKDEKVEQKADGTTVKEQTKTTVDHDTGAVKKEVEKSVETPAKP